MMTYYDNTNLIGGSKAEVLRYQIMVIQTDDFFSWVSWTKRNCLKKSARAWKTVLFFCLREFPSKRLTGTRSWK